MNIDIESNVNKNHVFDIENFRNVYYQKDYDNNIYLEFPEFSISTLDKNYYYILANCVKVDFKLQWSYRPDYASYDLYGSTVLWYLLLYTNNIFRIEDFYNLEYIIVPKSEILINLAKDRVKENTPPIDVYQTSKDSNILPVNTNIYKLPIEEINEIINKSYIYNN